MAKTYIQYWTLAWIKTGAFATMPILARYENVEGKLALRIESPRQAAAARNCMLFVPNAKLLNLNEFGDNWMPAPSSMIPRWYVHDYVVKAPDLIEANKALQHIREIYQKNNMKL